MNDETPRIQRGVVHQLDAHGPTATPLTSRGLSDLAAQAMARGDPRIPRAGALRGGEGLLQAIPDGHRPCHGALRRHDRHRRPDGRGPDRRGASRSRMSVSNTSPRPRVASANGGKRTACPSPRWRWRPRASSRCSGGCLRAGWRRAPRCRTGPFFCAVPGEQHTLGVMMAADLFRRNGWDVGLLIGVDHAEIVERLERDDRARHRPELLGRSLGRCAGASDDRAAQVPGRTQGSSCPARSRRIPLPLERLPKARRRGDQHAGGRGLHGPPDGWLFSNRRTGSLDRLSGRANHRHRGDGPSRDASRPVLSDTQFRHRDDREEGAVRPDAKTSPSRRRHAPHPDPRAGRSFSCRSARREPARTWT